MLSWGIVATLLGVTQNFGGFLAGRFFLGVTESGLFPGVVFYLSMWYKRSEQHYRVALFFSAASLAGAFGGILAYAIGKMDGVGHYAGWRWIFILVSLSKPPHIYYHHLPYYTSPSMNFILNFTDRRVFSQLSAPSVPTS
jgi:MFS family permease